MLKATKRNPELLRREMVKRKKIWKHRVASENKNQYALIPCPKEVAKPNPGDFFVGILESSGSRSLLQTIWMRLHDPKLACALNRAYRTVGFVRAK
ncbi:hypothetical protein AB3X91_06430 [Paraburkholderia sp. BR14263]|uniref:hypothetical protein n=1 Tax=unclassified Paraburkholderia TaxID=2615204 RepID=UPI0034CDA66D